MKNVFIFLIVFFMVENAKAVIGLSEFSIQTQYLSDGKLKVNNEKVTTAFKAEFILSRDLLSSGQFEAGNCTVSIIYTESPNYITQATSNNNYENDPSTIVLATKNVTSSDYNNGAVALMVDSRGKSTSCILPASKFLGKILLRIKYYDTSLSRDITVYSTTRYEIYVPHLTKIQSMGFSISGIKDFNSTYYLVEDDILIEKNILSDLSSYSNLVNNDYDHNINISMDESVFGNYSLKSGLYRAFEVWNYLYNSNIKLNLIDLTNGHYEVNPRVDVEIKGDNGVLLSNTAMVAAYPSSNGKPGEVILVNEDFNQNPEQATWNFIHAIAHSLGLKHAVNNSSSIMHRGDFRKNFPNFSNSFPTSYDEINISSMYPININSIIQPSIRGYNGVFSLSYVSIEDGISYHWKIIGTSGSPYFYEEVGTSTLSDMYLAKGNYRVECTISGTKYLTSVTATKNISIQ